MRTSKKFLSLLLVFAMVFSSIIISDGKTYAEGTSYKDGSVSENQKQNVDKIKFTHMEWTGKSYEDVDGNTRKAEDVFGINRDEHRLSIVPYQDEVSAINGVWDYNRRENSKYFDLLTGPNKKWELNVVQNEEEAMKYMVEDNSFINFNFVKNEEDTWKEVELPKSWPGLGFDFPIYTNVKMPFQTRFDPNVRVPEAPVVYNPVG